MTVATAIDVKKEVEKLFDHFDRQDIEGLQSMFAEDVQGVDEISKGWIRGRASIGEYFEKLEEMGVGDIHSSLSDLVAKHWDDVALATLVVDQTYRVDGEMVTIKAPASMLFRHGREGWKIQLVHAVPLPDD